MSVRLRQTRTGGKQRELGEYGSCCASVVGCVVSHPRWSRRARAAGPCRWSSERTFSWCVAGVRSSGRRAGGQLCPGPFRVARAVCRQDGNFLGGL